MKTPYSNGWLTQPRARKIGFSGLFMILIGATLGLGLADSAPPATPQAGGEDSVLQLAQARGQAAMLIGRWHCDGVFNNQPVSEEVSFTAGNYLRVITFQLSVVRVGGTYKAAMVANDTIQVSVVPANWSPPQICASPGNCVSTSSAFQPEEFPFRIVDQDTVMSPLATCRRMR